ncbi:hypothetical protein HJFPF1_08018 [Paramyrothecium foliicola]|nr:hypothetical protein HJFPF1_08018 [Paramyrothecium foliicola]
MDSVQSLHSDRSRGAQSRAPSRSSTSTSTTRMSSSTNMDLGYGGSSPQRSAYSNSRHHQASCSRASSSPRPSARSASRLSRESSGEVIRQAAQSSFLQEKLERERKAESEKVAQAASQSRLNVEMDAASGSSKGSQKSPLTPTDAEMQRPRSSGGPEGTKNKPLALKEMEQVVSNLLKQNFDLKLEIHHRRERQEKLESRVEALESGKQQLEEVNDKLLEELEKRDKAVEEAVAMIVMLEAKVEQLVDEQGLVQLGDANESLPSTNYSSREKLTSTPKPHRSSLSEATTKTLNRMPSFVSEHHEGTENLRNVYLNGLDSVLSLTRVPESQMENDNGPASPTLSVLSESSFLSVYGQKSEDKTESVKLDDIATFDGANRASSYDVAHESEANRRSNANAHRQVSGTSQSSASVASAPAQRPASVMEHRSPLQHIERLEQGNTKRERHQPPTPAKDSQNTRIPPGKSPSRQRTREEKRQALRKVITDAPGGVRLVDHGLPPTPDTISSSVLHRYKYSDDSLSQRRTTSNEYSVGAASEAAAMVQDLRTLPEVALASTLQTVQPPSQKGEPKYYDRIASFTNGRVPYQRPHSASETTVSRSRGNDWASDSDDTDARSVESSLDVWMQESAKPDRRGGRVSPDLFSFPTTTSGKTWATQDMFGRRNGHGGARVDFDNDQMHDLFSIQNALFASTAPPAPNRRSSLHARTASTSASAAGSGYTGYPPVQPRPQRSPDRVAPQIRRNSDLAYAREDLTTPVQTQFPPPTASNSEQKRHRYPPVSGQLGARIGLNKIFRRSISGAPPAFDLESAPPSTAPAAPVDDSMKTSGTIGVPSWVSRGPVAEDEFSSATPPPIMRNPRHSRTSSMGHEKSSHSAAVVEPTRPKTPSAAAAMSSSRQQPQVAPTEESSQSTGGQATGARRKWLAGFGRSSSLKNKAS